MVQFDGNLVDANSDPNDAIPDGGHVIELAVGDNEIEVVVTAEDPTVTKTYTVTVDRDEPPPSSDALLSGLELSGVSSVDLGFSSTDDDYDVNVPNGLTSTTVTATTNDAGASYVVQLDGVTDSDGTIPLAVGGNEITVVVTAEDGVTTKTYTVTVTRADPSGDATLSDLELTGVSARGLGVPVRRHRLRRRGGQRGDLHDGHGHDQRRERDLCGAVRRQRSRREF